MKLVWVTDENYLEGTVVSVHSALSAASSRDRLEVIVVLRGVGDEAKARLVDWSKKIWPGIKFRFRTYDTDIPFKAIGHISHAAYVRLYLPELLPDVERVIYLDCDTLVRRDLWQLWELDLAGAPAGGAIEDRVQCLGSEHGLTNWKEHGLDPKWPYINSGVLVLDLDMWRSQSIHHECLKALELHHLEFSYHDQDGLNFVLAGQWFVLPAEWNTVPRTSRAVGMPWLYRKFAQVFWVGPYHYLRESAILHFAGALKPWDSTILYPGALLYRRVRWQSKWMGCSNRKASDTVL